MNVVVALEEHLIRTDDGDVWTAGTSDYHFWERYLAVFDSVQPLARVSHQSEPEQDWKRVTGPGVSIIDLPDFHGPSGFARHYIPMRITAARTSDSSSAVILRAPGMVSSLLRATLHPTPRPYAVEVVGDPWDVFTPGAIEHPLRPIMRRQAAHELREACRLATAVSWVNSGVLPQRYPSSPGAYSTHCSSIELENDHFVDHPRAIEAAPEQIRIFTAAWLTQPYKGIDVLLDAMRVALPAVPGLTLTIAGDGHYRRDLEQQAESLGLRDRVTFLGQIPSGDPVRAELDQADIFILPSRTEGLPRAIIEAMARGLPCISTRVGGIPELLASEDLVDAGDINALASLLITVATDPVRLTRMSARNLIKARDYAIDVLSERRTALYRHLRTATEAWFLGKEVA